jgi:zinc and cadmium transporter
MNAQLLAIISVFGVSLASFSGLFALSLSADRLQRLSTTLISFAAGSLLGDAFIHLIPNSFAAGRPPLGQSLRVLGGMLMFFVVEKLMRHRHGAAHAGDHGIGAGRPELATINLLGDALHNFIDGVLIGASYLSSVWLGISTTIAVLFHEIPQELGDFSILIHSGMKPRTAVLLNFASASIAILGAVCALVAGSFAGTWLVPALIPVTAGGFVYLAAADLIPELQHDRSLASLLTQSGLMALGMGLMAVLTLLE